MATLRCAISGWRAQAARTRSIPAGVMSSPGSSSDRIAPTPARRRRGRSSEPRPGPIHRVGVNARRPASLADAAQLLAVLALEQRLERLEERPAAVQDLVDLL